MCCIIFSLHGLAQTEAYLTGLGKGDEQKGWEVVKKALTEGWHSITPDVFEKVKNFTIQKLLPIERKYSKDYYVFYHGQAAWFYAIQMLYRELYWRFKKLRAYQLAFLRRQADLYPRDKFVAQLLKETSNNINDNIDPHKRILLSVNLSFPGNLQVGENTSLYFASGSSFQAPNARLVIDYVVQEFLPFIHYFLKKYDINDLIDKLQQKIRNTFKKYEGLGCLLQIFVPKNEVEKYAYLSEPGGKPVIYDLSLKEILNNLNNPQLLNEPSFKILQARLLLNENLYFGVLQKDIKVIFHNEISQDIRTLIQKEVKKFVDELFYIIHSKITLRDWFKVIKIISKDIKKGVTHEASEARYVLRYKVPHIFWSIYARGKLLLQKVL